MTNEGYNEQLEAATKFILISEKESKNFKDGGQAFKETAELYKELNDKSIEVIAKGLSEKPAAFIPDEEKTSVYEKAKSGAEAGVKEAISTTEAKVPTEDQLIPVISAALNKVGPTVVFRREIKGKLWFWVAVGVFIICGVKICFDIARHNNFDGTAEEWAHRMYVAKKELSENNPGAGYDEIMMDFANGFPEKAKDAVIAKEKRVLELQNKGNKYERKISEFLFEDYASGIKILEIETRLEYKYEKKFLGFEIEIMSPQKIFYEYFFARAIPNDGQTELRIVMKRPYKLPGFKEKWDIYITTDKRINSISDYLHKSKKIDWLYDKKEAID